MVIDSNSTIYQRIDRKRNWGLSFNNQVTMCSARSTSESDAESPRESAPLPCWRLRAELGGLLPLLFLSRGEQQPTEIELSTFLGSVAYHSRFPIFVYPRRVCTKTTTYLCITYLSTYYLLPNISYLQVTHYMAIQ
jgi:hypothetical protein